MRKLNQERIRLFREGYINLFYGGKESLGNINGLREILTTAFPDDTSKIIGSSYYYARRSDREWEPGKSVNSDAVRFTVEDFYDEETEVTNYEIY